MALLLQAFCNSFRGAFCVYRQTSAGMLPDAYYPYEKT